MPTTIRLGEDRTLSFQVMGLTGKTIASLTYLLNQHLLHDRLENLIRARSGEQVVAYQKARDILISHTDRFLASLRNRYLVMSRG